MPIPILQLLKLVIILLFIWGTAFIFVWPWSSKGDSIRRIVVAILLMFTVFLFLGASWYYSNTAQGSRAWKTQQSNFNGGIPREVKVYSADGKLLEEYHGKFDLEYDNDRILFDDEKGMRHIIYYPTGTVIIDEVEE